MRLFVLLIEHNAFMAAELGRELRNAGFGVMALQDANEAIDLLRLVAFDLVLADVATLRYATTGQSGLTALLRVVRHAPVLRFTTPLTMGSEGSQGALLLEQAPRDLPRLLQAIDRLFSASAALSAAV